MVLPALVPLQKNQTRQTHQRLLHAPTATAIGDMLNIVTNADIVSRKTITETARRLGVSQAVAAKKMRYAIDHGYKRTANQRGLTGRFLPATIPEVVQATLMDSVTAAAFCTAVLYQASLLDLKPLSGLVSGLGPKSEFFEILSPDLSGVDTIHELELYNLIAPHFARAREQLLCALTDLRRHLDVPQKPKRLFVTLYRENCPYGVSPHCDFFAKYGAVVMCITQTGTEGSLYSCLPQSYKAVAPAPHTFKDWPMTAGQSVAFAPDVWHGVHKCKRHHVRAALNIFF